METLKQKVEREAEEQLAASRGVRVERSLDPYRACPMCPGVMVGAAEGQWLCRSCGGLLTSRNGGK